MMDGIRIIRNIRKFGKTRSIELEIERVTENEGRLIARVIARAIRASE